MLPSTTDRVPLHTAEHVNERIRRRTEENVRHHLANPGLIPKRLEELDQEWDIERAIEANAAAVGLFGLAAATQRRAWAVLPAAVLGFLMQHAISGWCPPVPILRRLGFRTAGEIEVERAALRRALARLPPSEAG